MKTKKYKQGDIIAVDFAPTMGHEQTGKRPGLIVSDDAYNNITDLYLVCPISTNMKEYPLHVELKGTKNVTGKVYCEHVRAMDLQSRHTKKIEECPQNVLEEAKSIIKLFLGQ